MLNYQEQTQSSTPIEDMPLSEMVTTTAIKLSQVFDTTEEARLLYNISCGNNPCDLVIFLNKHLTKSSFYEQHDLYGKGFEVFYGPLTDRRRFEELRKDVQRYGKAEGEMILYDKKNKPFLARLALRPVITMDDFDDYVLSYYLIVITRMPHQDYSMLAPALQSEKVASVISVSETASASSDSAAMMEDDQSKEDEPCQREIPSSMSSSAKTSRLSFSGSGSEADDEEEGSFSSHPEQSSSSSDENWNRSETGTTEVASSRSLYFRQKHHQSAALRREKQREISGLADILQSNTRERNSDHPLQQKEKIMVWNGLPEKERLTKTALKRLDDRSWDEVINSKRRKFIASKE